VASIQRARQATASRNALSRETIETPDDIITKNTPATPIVRNAEQRSANMLKPTFRFFIVPLGAICSLATLSGQNVSFRSARGSEAIPVRQQVIDCSRQNPREVCMISPDGEAGQY
jgi:hypothetical protein